MRLDLGASRRVYEHVQAMRVVHFGDHNIDPRVVVVAQSVSALPKPPLLYVRVRLLEAKNKSQQQRTDNNDHDDTTAANAVFCCVCCPDFAASY